eukprot:TRINITY_DN44473_c0_g1_i1.p1 TRINITY_DN44473_c0_g1~~TRINITY_DN44473_c0_g1_i1.p1  ORF type:complete len:136 (+),score=21.21 TRINITY_DN44473_c0_g1_i1:62-469(+)
MPSPVGWAAAALWRDSIKNEMQAAAAWENNWGFLKAEGQSTGGRRAGPGHSASAPSLHSAARALVGPQGAPQVRSLDVQDAMTRTGALRGLRKTPRERFQKPATTQQELGWRPSVEALGLRMNYGVRRDPGIWPS